MLRQRFLFPWTWQPIFTNIHDSAWRTDAGNCTRSVNLSLIRCLFRLVKCKIYWAFVQIRIVHIVIIITNLFNMQYTCTKCKREGHNLIRKKKARKYCGCCIPLWLCSSIARYCGYRDSPTYLFRWQYMVKILILVIYSKTQDKICDCYVQWISTPVQWLTATHTLRNIRFIHAGAMPTHNPTQGK